MSSKEISEWSLEEVGAWLDSFNFSGRGETIKNKFQHEGIDGEVLLTLTTDELKELGLGLGHRKKLTMAIAKLNVGSPLADTQSPQRVLYPAHPQGRPSPGFGSTSVIYPSPLPNNLSPYENSFPQPRLTHSPDRSSDRPPARPMSPLRAAPRRSAMKKPSVAPGQASFRKKTLRFSVAIGKTQEQMLKSRTQIIEEMVNGVDWISFGLTGYPKREEVSVFYDPHSGGKFGSIYWCPRGKRRKLPEQCLPVTTLTDIFVGKQQMIWQSAICLGTNEDCCISLLGKNKELHAEAPTVNEIQDWMSGLNHILTHGDAGRVQLVGKENVKAGNGRNFSRRTFSVLPSKRTGFDPVLPYEKKATEAVQVMTLGLDFMAYFGNEHTTKVKKIHLFYNAKDSIYGTLFWCSPGSRVLNEACCLPLHTLCDVYVGIQQPIFKSRAAAKAREECCFSLLGQNKALYLEGPSQAEVNTWLSGIKHVLTEGGQEVEVDELKQVKTREGKAYRKMRFSVAIGKTPSALPKQEIVSSLEQGAPFTRFLMHETTSGPRTDVEELWLWYVAADGRSGAFYWTTNGTRDKVDGNRMDVHSITDIFVGKHQPIFHQPVTDGCPENCAVTIASRGSNLHLQARNDLQLKTWLAGINYILTSTGGKRMQLIEAERVRTSSANDQGFSRRTYSVIGASDSSSPGQGYGMPGTANQPLKDAEAVQEMNEGSIVTRYFISRGKMISTDLFLFYAPEVNRFGTLYWCAPGSRSRSLDACLPLHLLTDLYVGHQQDIFSHPALAHTHEESCFTLVGSQNTVLHVEANTEQQAATWLSGISFVLTEGGSAPDNLLAENS